MFFLIFAYVYFYFRPQVVDVCRIKSDKYQDFVSGMGMQAEPGVPGPWFAVVSP